MCLFCLCSTLFAEREEVQRVYLASYPRCGNTWTRHMIETAVNRTTFCPVRANPILIEDFGRGFHHPHGFRGKAECPKEGEPFIVKTHYFAHLPGPYDCLPYKKTIRLIRHPVDSFYSHYIHHQKRLKLPVEDSIPRDFLCHCIAKWRRFQEHWDRQENVITIRYEDLLKAPDYYLRIILDAAGYEFTEEDIYRAVSEYPPEGEPLKHLFRYTKEDLLVIQNGLSSLMAKYGYAI